MKRNILLIVAFIWFGLGLSFSQDINYVKRFANENHPEIGYWFISPDLLKDNRYLEELDSIIHQCPYTLVFLTARDGADFYDFKTMYPVFKKIVETAHRSGLKIGLQLWGNYKDKTIDGSQRMIAEDEVQLDESGKASYTAQARFVRFPDRLLKTDLFRVYAFKKTADGFYDPATLKDITSKCTKNLPDKKTVEITINGGAAVKGLTACIMTQEYCSQSSMWGDVEINGFVDAMQHYKDISFNGFALDEYGNKFVERPNEGGPDFIFRGQWYSTSMAAAFKNSKGKSLDKVLFDSRYAPQDKPEIRMKAINEYMEFMRGGALRVENAVYKKAKEIFGQNIFIGIHDTYHNHLTNDEIWANGISWWKDPPGYGQTDEKTPLPIQMGIAMAHTKNAMYNQYYDKIFPPVQEKALFDLRYGVRTHYHAMHDKRPNRFDLLMPDAIDGINKVERGARLLNKFNPSLPEVKLLVVFGMEALQNWYPNNAERGMYDINDKLGIEEKAVEIWNAGYLNALIPSDLIADGQLKIGSDGKPVINGHQFDAVVYLYPQYAKESELKFLEDYEKKGGKLMIEGKADHDFNANDISKRFRLIYDKATVKGCSVDDLSKLGISKNLLRDGCKNADGSYVFTNLNSIKTDAVASFSVNIDGDTYTGQYKGLAVIGAEKKGVLKKFGASGFKELTQNGKVLLRFDEPVDIFISKQGVKYIITLADASKKIKPEINKL
ncbi:MAG TPA: hypothetical protein VHD35_00070 [Chitinophagaceae bacterium]|nr:hypothetical protein [Chitinophagaceae bacterium]